MPGDVIRRVCKPDVAAVVGLVHELAEYERSPVEYRLTRSRLRRALFGAKPTLFGHVAQARGTVVGCALWRPDFCSGDDGSGDGGSGDGGSGDGGSGDGGSGDGGPALYLQDLYIQPAHRGRGLGRGLLAALAAEGSRRGLVRLEWSVLDWNVLAQGFYRSVGARPDGARSAWRMERDALSTLAAQATAE